MAKKSADTGKGGNPDPSPDTRFGSPKANPGNPGGKPVGSRNKLQGDFLRALSEDFAENGKTAIQDCREQKPDAYIRAIASLMPKELEIRRPLEDLSDDELDGAIAILRERLASARGPGAGASHAPSAEQARGVQTLQ